uniref:Uncharacterized protein n=1 Tax=Pseudomonas fluorescens (strain SBW25) TaxID=216595 RepID=A0A0G4E5G3_PSEFS|nr:hypothetical protein [Pseudomonas fluorescens]CEK42217.1 hypothetical protein PQBR57_0264 [Pseudomonas fluorescens SBW25]
MNQMNDFPTMQVVGLDLRKTESGWQYLNEGVHNEPDSWCDASSSLGPFSNAGVNSLLDELLAARLQADQAASSICRNCRHWDSNGNCDFIETIQGERVANTTGCQIIATVHDDSGLWTVLKTAPRYSCPNFSATKQPAAPTGSFR